MLKIIFPNFRTLDSVCMTLPVKNDDRNKQSRKTIKDYCVARIRVFDKIFSLNQIGSGQAMAEPLHF